MYWGEIQCVPNRALEPYLTAKWLDCRTKSIHGFTNGQYGIREIQNPQVKIRWRRTTPKKDGWN